MFITPEELYTHLYEESVTAISGNDTHLLESAISAAIGEVKGYLHRYDTQKLFGAVGIDRDTLLLLWVKDVAVWHYINIANPGVDFGVRKLRYEYVRDTLKDIQREYYLPDFPLKADGAGASENTSGFRIGSNQKRSNHI